MIIQIINITHYDIFKRFSSEYKIFRDIYYPGIMGLEIREISKEFAEEIQKIVLAEGEICYKNQSFNENNLNLFIPAALSVYKDISRKILSSGDEELGYKLIQVIKNYEDYDHKSFTIAGKDYPLDSSYVMGILNVTPDSFSDGGLYNKPDDAVSHALEMWDDGADFIDIGGESTRPGSKPVPVDEELERVIPVIEKILSENPDVKISVDTTKNKVAEEALKKGAIIINDISGLTSEPEIAETVKKYNAGLVIMHMKGTPENMQTNPYYDDVVGEIYEFLFNRITGASKAGVKNIIIDPGIGFGKRIEDNFEILKRLEDFKSLGYPLLVGVSRKSFLGTTLELGIDKRDTVTAIAEAIAVKNGARIIRTHNVQYGKHVIKLLKNLI